MNTLRRTVLGAGLLLVCAGAVLAQASTATIVDSAEADGRSAGLFFVVTEVNGSKVGNALDSSARASQGRGAALTVVGGGRELPAGKTRLKLVALQYHAAPIMGLFSALRGSGPPQVSGEVEVDLKPGARYRVQGVLDNYRAELWLEELGVGPVPGTTLKAAGDPELQKLMEGAAFTTTNLRYEDDWISDSPQPHLPFVPAGARLKVRSYGNQRAEVLIDGRKMRIGVDYGRQAETIQQLVARITSNDDPRPQIAAWPEPVREAVRAARVIPGMSREQVAVALGRPRMDLLPKLEAAEWPYVVDSEEAWLVFDANGKLQTIDASRKTRGLLWLAAPAPAPSPAAPATAASAPVVPASAASSPR